MSFTSFYNDLSQNPNLLSHWFPAVKDCGMRVPRTEIIPVPEHVAEAFFMERQDKDFEIIYRWVKEMVMPIAKQFPYYGNTPFLFMKNGSFSDKFNARNCYVRRDAPELTMKLMDMNYDAIMVDAYGIYGITELILREYIPYTKGKVPCIYNGLPLRPEFRVFYDFDEHRTLYSVNYWDWDYCHDAISQIATDQIIYEKMYPVLSKQYDVWRDAVEKEVEKSMKTVTGLSGRWSVDILLDETDTLWLIDMAVARQSAYWDPEKCR